MTTMNLEWKWSLQGLEWIARVASIASICLLVDLFIGEALHPSQIAAREWVALLFFPVGVVVGMIVAWRNEGTGAAVTVGSHAAFYLHYGFHIGKHIGGWAFVAFAAPGFLFLLHWLLVRQKSDA